MMENKNKMDLSKRSEEFAFKHHKDYDVSKIKELIKDLDQEWVLGKDERFQHKALHGTFSYFLHKYDIAWKVKDPYIQRRSNQGSALWNAVYPIVMDLKRIHGGRMGNVMLAMLNGNSIIPAHWDVGDYLDVSRRNHIPIITNDEVIFSIDGEDAIMKEGQCWEINNNKIHRVENKSTLSRVHLIIDIIPQQYLS
jgi:hypothetical protein